MHLSTCLTYILSLSIIFLFSFIMYNPVIVLGTNYFVLWNDVRITILFMLKNSGHRDYYSTDKFNENCVANVNDLNIIHCNIRSLYAHHDEFLSLLSVLRDKFDILCFSQSWLTDATKQLINFRGYSSFHSLRPINKRGAYLLKTLLKQHIFTGILYLKTTYKLRLLE